MKKTAFFITVRDHGKTTTRKVTGYYEYVAGLPIGLHKVAERAWVATELSTGLSITTCETRVKALEKVSSMAGVIHSALNDDAIISAKERISAAYSS